MYEVAFKVSNFKVSLIDLSGIDLSWIDVSEIGVSKCFFSVARFFASGLCFKSLASISQDKTRKHKYVYKCTANQPL